MTVCIWWGIGGLAVATCLASPPRAATMPADGAACQGVATVVEWTPDLLPELLGSIGVVESGQAAGVVGRVAPWPWTINAAGRGAMFVSKTEAAVAVLAAQATGTRTIDVDCFRVSPMHHINAFPMLVEAYKPSANAQCAGLFLTRLHRDLDDRRLAVGSYHSSTPGMSGDHVCRRIATWGMNPTLACPARTAAQPSALARDGGLLQAPLAEAAADRAYAGLVRTERGAAVGDRVDPGSLILPGDVVNTFERRL